LLVATPFQRCSHTASAALVWWCAFIAARCDLCWWYRVRWSLAFAFASVRMGSCHVVTRERKCKRELSANYVHNYFIRSVFRVHLYSAMYSPPVLSIKSRGLTAWLWLFNSQAEPKAVTGRYFGPAWPGLFGLGLARLTA
jgi:hypothetical protein